MKQIKVLIVILFLLPYCGAVGSKLRSLNNQNQFQGNLLFLNYQTADLSIFLIAVVTFLFGVVVVWLFRAHGAPLVQTADQSPYEGREKQ